MGENRKTTFGPKFSAFKGLVESVPAKPILKVKNRGGAPKGNSNAFKTGFYAEESKDLRRRVRAFRHRVDAVLAAITGKPTSPTALKRAQADDYFTPEA